MLPPEGVGAGPRGGGPTTWGGGVTRGVVLTEGGEGGFKPYEFIGLGAMDVTKTYELIRFGAMDVTKPYEFNGLTNICF